MGDSGAPVRPPGSDQETSDDEHFSDASEGKQSNNSSIPTTRVERTDDVLSHGEVPGTEAHDMRKQDALPDEFEIIPESDPGNPENESSISIPKTVIEKVDPESKSHGEEPGTLAHDMRKADAAPDSIQEAPDVTRQDLEVKDTDENETFGSDDDEEDDEKEAGDGQTGADDDFDDFEEGDEEADDFGTFDDGDAESEHRLPLATPSIDISKPSLPLFDFEGLGSVEDITAASEAYSRELFPDAYQHGPVNNNTEELPEMNPAFLTERSQSLWAQLVAPPPLQPPDWIRSRIRRLFLVSLGVPVDLDEILPASKQKKLILPSMEIEGENAQYRTEEPQLNGTAEKLKQNNASAASVAASGPSKSERRKRGPPRPPDLNLNAARLLCATTDAALKNLMIDELKGHVGMLEDYKARAGNLLEYWLIRKDSANGDKEAFEEVIENLVKHAKKIRK